MREIENLKTASGDKPHDDATIYDCGELTGSDYDSATEKAPDATGDPYEDFPEDQKPEDSEWAGAQILKIATELKDMGNAAFKKGDLNAGLKKYQKALRYLHEYPTPLDGDPKDLWPALSALKISVYSNSALLENKTSRFAEAAESATKALDIEGITDKDKAKALFRRGQAKLGKRNEEGALDDFTQAAKYAPGDAAITREMEGVKKRVSARKDKEKKAYKNAFNFD